MLINILRQMFTGKDGVTHDMGRYSWALSFAAVLALTAFHCWKGTAPSITELAASLVAVATGHGAALFFKRDTEPTN